MSAHNPPTVFDYIVNEAQRLRSHDQTGADAVTLSAITRSLNHELSWILDRLDPDADTFPVETHDEDGYYLMRPLD